MSVSTESKSAPSQTGRSSPRLGTDTPLTEASVISAGHDVAIVGMACRAAGGNTSAEKLWESIINKVDASGEIPPMRWEPYYRRDIRNKKTLDQTTKRGYFIDHVEDFDAAFFGISPKEAEQMDPQQRLSLEVTWEALENAGIPPPSLSGSDTAVFMGVNSDDYAKLILEDLPRTEAWMGIGTAYCGIPNRISYHLNLMGPSTAVDAACASSLVAIHHGRQAILQGESRVAIAGGVNVLCGPGLTSVLDKAGATSPEGRCLSFDDSAHGYGRGEGAAVVILKHLADAISDGDHILAVLKGSAVAQDGKTNGIMAPNAKAQELVAKKALEVAKMDPLTVSYVEAHATSTPLGDPTEVSAISAVYGVGRLPAHPCFIGSIKPNIGHLEAGAGAMGFIKAALAVNKGILPPQTNLSKLNSRINWDEAGVRVVQDVTEWPETDHPRRAAVCSYGYGGTVSHAVIEQYLRDELSVSPSLPHYAYRGTGAHRILLLSAPQEKRLAAHAKMYAQWLGGLGGGYDLGAVATTLSTRRGHHDYRVAFVVDGHQDAIQALESFSGNNATEWTASRRVLGADAKKGVVWMFSGHGAQWSDMAKDLVKNPIFRAAIDPLDSIVQAECGFSALDLLTTGQFESSVEVQVLTFIMQIGLVAVLNANGLQPDAVIGHSVGEIAASVTAGCLTPEEGTLIISRRANLYRKVMGLGAMLLVNKSFALMQEELAGRTDLVAAIDSSPASCVVSGEKEAVEALADAMKTQGLRSFRVRTDVAFHHPMLEALVQPMVDCLADALHPQPPTVPLYSTSRPDVRSDASRDILYWTNNMVNPVRLTPAICGAAEDGFRMFLEVSAHPLLAHSVNETLVAQGYEDFAVTSIMTRGKPAEKTILSSIAQLHCLGAAVDWERQMGSAWVGDLPTISWTHKPVWKQIETGPLTSSEMHDVDKHTLLGQAVTIVGEDTILYTTRVDDKTKPFPGSHPLHGSEIVPAAALVNTFLHATGAKTLSNIVLRVPVAISQQRDIQVVVRKDEVKICSRLVPTKEGTEEIGGASWLTHTTGSWHAGSSSDNATANAGAQNMNVEAIKARINSKLADNFSIDYLDKVGVSAMGFPWAITEHYGNLDEMIARVDVAPQVQDGGPLPWDVHSWAPILDSATSVGSTIFFDNPRLRMPAQIEKTEIFTTEPPPKTGYLYVERATQTAFASHVSVLDEEGNLLAKFTSMRFSEIEGTVGVSGSVDSLVHQLDWPPATYTEEPLEVKQVVLVSGDRALARSYDRSLHGRVNSVTLVSSAAELAGLAQTANNPLSHKNTIIVYAPGCTTTLKAVPSGTHNFLQETLDIVKLVENTSLLAKVFVLTDRVSVSEDATALAQASLHGLARIIASEHPELWGGLIDLEAPLFPLETIKYVRDADVIRIMDGIPRVARLRPLRRSKLLPKGAQTTLIPRPQGTYLITGGLGALGLEVAEFLVESGARRIVLVSRRSLPSRSEWGDVPESSPISGALSKIHALESRGATVYCVAADLGAPSGASDLSAALTRLSLPPVLGVVHAAGVLEDQLVLSTTADSFARVLAPKVSGTLALHALFPVGSGLDFMVLFSSCGQLFGFPGQASYASGNAFLDSLATYRRQAGDKGAIAMQWTSWRGLGMAASTDFIDAELATKGITDITRDEAFRAWNHLAKYDMDHGVVLRCKALEADEPLPVPILADIAIRKTATSAGGETAAQSSAPASVDAVPATEPERRAYFDEKIRACVAKVLHMSGADDVDSKAPLSDLGVDSVMTVTLRGQLQKSLGIKVPPTLTWSCPTVSHLVGWFVDKISK